MKKNNTVRVILTCLAIILFACMAMGSSFSSISGKGRDYENELKKNEEFKEYCEYINSSVEACTGTCLTREEMAQLVYNFEKIQTNQGEDRVFDLKLETPGEHQHDEKTRYSITTLETDELGVYRGLKVSVMSDTSDCKIEEPEPQQAEAGLPVKEIVGTYVLEAEASVIAHDKDEEGDGKEVGSTELKFVYTVSVIEGNKLSISLNGVKSSEGVYDPATGICDFKVLPEYFEANGFEPVDRTDRFTFSKKDGQVRFESIQLGIEDPVPAIAIKVE